MISAVGPSQSTFFTPFATARGETTPAKPEKSNAVGSSAQAQGQLTEEEQALVDELKKTDKEVRAHEQAHKNAGGQYAGSASFSYQSGPDGKRYAVGGEVPIDIAPVEGDPRATIAKMTVIIAAALAPSQPSGQDRSVAAQAGALKAEAQAELAASPEAGTRENETSAPEGKSTLQPAFDLYKAASTEDQAAGQILNLVS